MSDNDAGVKFFLNLIVLLGTLQGLIITTLLFVSRKNNRYANRLLAFFILTISLACFNLYSNESGLTGNSEFIRWMEDLIPFINAMALGPLLYFYTKSVTDPEFRISKRQRLHFLPMLLDCVPQFIVWIFIIGVIFKWWSPDSGRGWGDFIDEWNAWGDIPRWASMSIYAIFSARIVYANLKQNTTGKQDFQWLKLFLNFVLAFQVFWLVFLVPYIIPETRYKFLDQVGWYPLYIPMTIIVYWLGIRGYIQSQLNTPKKNSATTLPREIVEQTIRALTVAMEESKLYLDPGLTVSELSIRLKIPQKTISGILNQHLNTSFNEYLNTYRVEAVKKRLLAANDEHLTITGIALECGFNSQATFQRAFKSITNLSPTEFQQQFAAEK